MEEKELIGIQKILKRTMILSVVFYALLILSVFTVFDSLLDQNMKIFVIIGSPMAIAGVALCILKWVKQETDS